VTRVSGGSLMVGAWRAFYRREDVAGRKRV